MSAVASAPHPVGRSADRYPAVTTLIATVVALSFLFGTGSVGALGIGGIGHQTLQTVSAGHALVQNIRRGHYELGTNTDLHRIGGCANGSGSATEGCPWPPRGSIGRRYVPAGLEPCPGCGWVTVLWSGCTVCDPRSAVPALPTLRG
ncbi:hypothetical protein FRAHR75_220032 [Frankia sp. Hr75.2]|nr:hypothetical protein FRAHR75_220032 [Frankia sp. Hr75.2]